MSPTEDRVLVADAIARLHAAAGLPWPPPAILPIKPVPLDRLICTNNKLTHEAIPALTRSAVGMFLARWDIHRPELIEDKTPLAGFLFVNANGGVILVNADDPLPRRRFTAAHELGHYLLHLPERLRKERDPETYLMQEDEAKTVREEEKSSDDKALSLPDMERQANLFAAELLMPETLCRFVGDGVPSATTRRFLEHQLSSDLLVSRDAARWRLRNLRVTN
jgi:Zn-dependent peptidase ImmA (M78 family)